MADIPEHITVEWLVIEGAAHRMSRDKLIVLLRELACSWTYMVEFMYSYAREDETADKALIVSTANRHIASLEKVERDIGVNLREYIARLSLIICYIQMDDYNEQPIQFQELLINGRMKDIILRYLIKIWMFEEDIEVDTYIADAMNELPYLDELDEIHRAGICNFMIGEINDHLSSV